MASRLQPRCAGPGLPVGELWLRVLCKILVEWRLCVWHYVINKVPYLSGSVSGWRDRVKFTLESIPRFTSATHHTQCYSHMISALSPCEKALARQNTMRHRRCAARESRVRVQREQRVSSGLEWRDAGALATSPSICPSPTCGRREARKWAARSAKPSGQREEHETAE